MKEYMCFRGHTVVKIYNPLNDKYSKYYCKTCKAHLNEMKVTEKLKEHHPREPYTRPEYLD